MEPTAQREFEHSNVEGYWGPISEEPEEEEEEE